MERKYTDTHVFQQTDTSLRSWDRVVDYVVQQKPAWRSTNHSRTTHIHPRS